jgi:hypothetical protein
MNVKWTLFAILIMGVVQSQTVAFNDISDPVMNKEVMKKRVSFKVRGNGKQLVKLGLGYQVGSGACCTGVSKESTVGFTGNTGDVLYDSETKRVIVKVYDGLEGQTIDLRQYY